MLKEEIEHHVGEEERWLTGIFSQAKRHGVDMDALGAELAREKARYEAEVAKHREFMAGRGPQDQGQEGERAAAETESSLEEPPETR